MSGVAFNFATNECELMLPKKNVSVSVRVVMVLEV